LLLLDTPPPPLLLPAAPSSAGTIARLAVWWTGPWSRSTPREPIRLQLRATFCNKVKTQAALGIVWNSACGMLLRCTSLFCGRVGEEALVWLHHKLLDEFPAEFAALVDKGFTHCVGAYYPIPTGMPYGNIHMANIEYRQYGYGNSHAMGNSYGHS
jgi:hypothetical protein